MLRSYRDIPIIVTEAGYGLVFYKALLGGREVRRLNLLDMRAAIDEYKRLPVFVPHEELVKNIQRANSGRCWIGTSENGHTPAHECQSEETVQF
jgi:hypothetical protein